MRTLIKNGLLIDPSNAIQAKLNLLLEKGKVKLVTTAEPEADMVIDATGKVVCPGFIDIHMHEDYVGADGHIEDDDTKSIFRCSLRMGVTTVLGGQCGINRYDPVKYLDLVDRDGAPVNVALLIGHGYAREAVGNKDKYGKASEAELVAMEKLIKEALEAGCFGVSYGMRYVPGLDEREMIMTALPCVAQHKLIAAHVRDDAEGIFAATREFLDVAQKLAIPAQYSHIGSMAGFGQMKDFLGLIAEYKMNGVDVSCDCYPYYAFSTMIGATTYDDGWMERYQCGYDVIEMCEGKYKGMRCTKEIFEEERREHPEHLTVCYVMKEEDVDLALRTLNVMLGSDGIMNNGQGHPRAAGSFTRIFSEFVRKGKLSLDEAILMCTAMPAQKLGLTHKGTLRAGADADIVIFDPDKIKDNASFSEPTLPGEGIDYVLIGGEIAAKDCKVVNASLGRAVRK
ncbi:MAG: amidohydrolase family protein [Phascolarctobacterium sp.]|nr:amidohydrolase family protein [Phascolarctobacterium sp.]